GLDVLCANVLVTGLQFNLTGSTNGVALVATEAATVIIDRAIIKNSSSGTGLKGVYITSGCLRNSIIYDFSTTSSEGVHVQWAAPNYVYNNTIYNCTLGMN